MIKLKTSLSCLLIICLLSGSVHAGITTNIIATGYAQAQAIVQKISAKYAELIAKFQNNEMANYGSTIIRKEVTSDNSPLLTAEDVKFYTDSTFTSKFTNELNKEQTDKTEGPNVLKLHQIVKDTYLVDYTVKHSLSETDRIDLESNAVIKIDPFEDAKRTNTQEFMQHKRYISLHHCLAIAEKILALMSKQDDELKSMASNIKSRREVNTLENGLAWLDKKIGMILNEILVIESSLLEINSTLLMQDKQRQIVQAD